MKCLKSHRPLAFLCFAAVLISSMTPFRALAEDIINYGYLTSDLRRALMYSPTGRENLINESTGYLDSQVAGSDGMYMRGGMTATNKGIITVREEAFNYGMRITEASKGINTGNIFVYKAESKGIYLEGASTGYNYGTIRIFDDGRGIYAVGSSSAINYGSITTETGSAYCMVAESSTIENRGSLLGNRGSWAHVITANLSTVSNSGTITTEESNNAVGILATDSTVNNSGIMSILGTNAAAISATGSTVNNSGTITSKWYEAVYLDHSTFTNSGTLSGGTFQGVDYAAVNAINGSQVYLNTGTNIQTGGVYGGAGANILHLVDSGTVDFAITGVANGWAEVHKTGAGTWTLAQDTGADGAINTFSLDDGTLALNAGTHLTVSQYTQAADTTLAVKLNGDGTVPVTVNGLATVAGTLAVDVDSSTMIGDQTVIAAGSIAGNFDSVTSVNPNFSLTSTVSGNNIVLTTPSYAPKWDNTALSMTSTLASNMAFIQIPTARSQTMLAANDMKEEDEYVVVASNGPLTELVSSPSTENRYGVYAKPMFSISERDAVGTALGYDAIMAGVEIGADTFVNDNMLLGAFAGYAATGIDFKGNAFSDDDTEDQNIFVLGAYGGYRMDDWTFTDTLSFSYAQHDSKRNAGLSQTAKADYNSQLIGNQFLASYRLTENDTWTLAPELGLNTSYFYRGNFTETGAVNAATYDSLDALFIESVVGINLSGNIETESATFTPYAQLNWTHDLNGNDITVRQTLGATSAQVTQENDDDHLSVGIGGTVSKGSMKYTLSYTGEASQHSRSHGISAIARYEF